MPAPAAQIFAGPALTEIRKSSIKPVKVVCFAPTASFAIVRLATMWKDDIDRPDMKEYLEQQAKAAGKDLNDYATEVCIVPSFRKVVLFLTALAEIPRYNREGPRIPRSASHV